jgi:uncharacterized protein YegP (UPF0339 family)
MVYHEYAIRQCGKGAATLEEELGAQNGEIIAESGAYESKEGCRKRLASVKENAAKAVIKDYTT